jgi:hypothetical protein
LARSFERLREGVQEREQLRRVRGDTPHAGQRAGREISVKRLEELASDNGQLIFKAYHRVDGRPILTDAMRLLVHSAT